VSRHAPRGDQLIQQYLERLDAGAATTGMSRDQSVELVNDIRNHIQGELRAAGRAARGDPTRVREVLGRLGSPEEIAGAAADRPPPPPGIHQGPLKPESVAITLLALSPIAGFVEIGLRQGGWLLVYAVAATFVVKSGMWPRREKVLGLLVIPVAALVLIAGLAWRVSEPFHGLDGIILGIGSAVGGIYLQHRVDTRIAAVVSRRSHT
jgi:hypothetical protein